MVIMFTRLVAAISRTSLGKMYPLSLGTGRVRPEYSRGNKRLQTQALPSSSSFVLDSLLFEYEYDDEDDRDSDISVCFIGVTKTACSRPAGGRAGVPSVALPSETEISQDNHA